MASVHGGATMAERCGYCRHRIFIAVCFFTAAAASTDATRARSIPGEPVQAIVFRRIEATAACRHGEAFLIPGGVEYQACDSEENGINALMANTLLRSGRGGDGSVRFWKAPNGLGNASLLLSLPQVYSLMGVSFEFVSPLPTLIQITGSQLGGRLRTLRYAASDPSTCKALRKAERSGVQRPDEFETLQPAPCYADLSNSQTRMVNLDLLKGRSLSGYGRRTVAAQLLVDHVKIDFFGHQHGAYPFYALSGVRLSGYGHCNGASSSYRIRLDGTYVCEGCRHGRFGKMCERKSVVPVFDVDLHRVRRQVQGRPPARSTNSSVHFQVTDTSANMTWFPPPPADRYDIITRYVVRYQKEIEIYREVDVKTTLMLQLAVSPNDDGQNGAKAVMLTNLSPASEYSVVIQACSKYGCSAAPPKNRFRTEEAAPLVATGRINPTEERKQINLIWSPPELDKRNGLITRYRITVLNTKQYGFMPASLQHPVALPNIEVGSSQKDQVKSQQIESHNLEEGYTYNFTIRACTGAGHLLKCSPKLTYSASTLEAAPDSAALPGSVHLEKTIGANNTLTVFWKPPVFQQRNGIIERYVIDTKITHQYGRKLNTPLTAAHHQIVVLPTFSEQNRSRAHDFLVEEDFTYFAELSSCLSLDGQLACSPPSDSNTLRTQQAAPVTANSGTIHAGNVTSRSFELTWSPPAFLDRNGIISHYVVHVANTRRYGLWPADENDLMTDTDVHVAADTASQNGTQHLTVRNLEEDFSYRIAVQACTDRSLCSPEVVAPGYIRTVAAAPDVPLTAAIRIDSTRADLAVLTWLPPPFEQRNGLITRYYLFYSNVTHADKPTVQEGHRVVTVNSSRAAQDSPITGRLDGLLPESVYRVKIQGCVVANDEDLCSANSSTQEFMTGKEVPSPPQSVSITGEPSQHSITITWLPPLVTYGSIILYEIIAVGISRSRPGEPEAFKFFSTSDSESSGQESLTMQLLPAGFNYTITVRAKSVRGFGNESSPVYGHTKAGVPPPSTDNVSLDPSTPLPHFPNHEWRSPLLLSWPVERLDTPSGRIQAYQIVVVRLAQLSNLPAVVTISEKAAACTRSTVLRKALDACIAMEFSPAVFGSGGHAIITVGSGAVTSGLFNNRVYFNPLLHPNTVYTIFLQGFIDLSSKRRRRQEEGIVAGQYSGKVVGSYLSAQRTGNEQDGVGSSLSSSRSTTGRDVAIGILTVVAFAGILACILLVYKLRKNSKGASLPCVRPRASDFNARTSVDNATRYTFISQISGEQPVSPMLSSHSDDMCDVHVNPWLASEQKIAEDPVYDRIPGQVEGEDNSKATQPEGDDDDDSFDDLDDDFEDENELNEDDLENDKGDVMYERPRCTSNAVCKEVIQTNDEHKVEQLDMASDGSSYEAMMAGGIMQEADSMYEQIPGAADRAKPGSGDNGEIEYECPVMHRELAEMPASNSEVAGSLPAKGENRTGSCASRNALAREDNTDYGRNSTENLLSSDELPCNKSRVAAMILGKVQHSKVEQESDRQRETGDNVLDYVECSPVQKMAAVSQHADTEDKGMDAKIARPKRRKAPKPYMKTSN